jgi:hypothetical protein
MGGADGTLTYSKASGPLIHLTITHAFITIIATVVVACTALI